MRIFLAVFPSPKAQAAAADVIGRLRRPGDGVSWVKRENLHYTLRFMGELGESALARVVDAAREGVAGHRPFEAVLGEAGAFPSPDHARALWLGLARGAEALGGLADSVEQALQRRSFERADHRFTAHLTLGRVREGEQDWSGRFTDVGAEPAAPFTVDRVTVAQSTLSPRGAIYEVRDEARMQA